MVGFGSSLRISRRRGWESAYLDYESLKLLLTHIEAVYEETRHLADRADSAAADGGAGGGGFGLGLIGVPHGHGRGGGGGEDRHVSALGHVNFHFMETDDDMENRAHPHPNSAVGDMRSGRGSRLEGDDDDDDKKRERQDQQKRRQETPGDYRDELFLESDSDYAYMSVGEGEGGSDLDDDDDSIGHHHNIEAGDMSGRMGGHRNDHDGMGRSAGVEGYEYNNSDDEDAEAVMGLGPDEAQRFDYGTAAVDAPTTQKPQQDASEDIWRQQQMKDQHSQYGSGGADSRNFGSGGLATAEDPDDAVANDAAREDILAEDDAYLTDTSAHGEVIDSAQERRYVYEPLSQIQSESSALLRHSSRKNVAVEESTSFFSIFSRKKKEEDSGRDRNKKVQRQQQQQPKMQAQASAGVFTNFGRSVVVGGDAGANAEEEQRQMTSHQQYQQERIIPITRVQSNVNGDAPPRKRRVWMKRTKRRKRSRRKRRVPIHILIAHSKARAITERFLGLLRAEVEKVTLFAHARMGELADTVGSLRFPSYDDGTIGNKRDYPLSDGGIHPSASSSSDEFGRTISWSESSSEDRDDERIKMRLEQKMNVSGRNRGPRRSVAAVAASVTAASKRSSSLRRTPDNQVSPHQGIPGYPTLTSDQDLVLKQIQHAEQLRMARPTFQRAEHVLDDDFLLLSAVDEADAFAAVGVELMHLLRYICVNVIAVRKICKKHDRLLANRMLGGYYHRLRQQRRETEKAFKRLGLGAGGKSRSGRSRQSPQGLSGLDGGAVSGQAPLLGRMFASTIGNELEGNLDKLVGVLDMKIQQLANSTTIEMISSVLAFALSEYEITQNRADALSKVNTATALRRAGSSAASLGSADADELEGLCYHFPIPKSATFGLSPSPRKTPALSSAPGYAVQQPRSPVETTFSSHSHDFDSNSSNMSLTRLKFVVASVYGLREAARPKQNHFRGYLSRAAMTFTGPNVVGDGLDGCSRETLEFLVAYDPDAALFVPCDTLYRSLQRGKSKGTVCGVMTASLAAANNSGETGSDYTVQNALTIMPVPSDYEYLESGLSSTLKGWKATVADGDVIVQRGTVRLNRLSVFLSCMNYYIISPSARAHTMILGQKMAHSATLIGMASISSIIGALVHSYLLSKDDTASKLPSAGPFFFRVPFILSAMSALAGNIIYADASRHNSLLMAYCGRFLVGFGSTEVLNCNLISKCIPPAGLVSESAKLVKGSMIGILIGPLMGMFLAIGEKEIISPFGEETLMSPRSVAAPGYFMAGLWFLQICGLLCFFQEPKKKAIPAPSDDKEGKPESIPAANTVTKAIGGNKVRDNTNGRGDSFVQEDNGFVSDSSSSSPQNAEIAEKRNLLYRTLSDATPDDLETAYGTNPSSADRGGNSRANSKNFAASDDEYASPDVAIDKRQRRRRPFLSSMNRTRKLVFHNVALPATIAILAFATFALETIFSSCAIITHRYFHWNSALAGLWLTALGSLVLPVNYAIESISRYREERIVMKIGLLFVGLGLAITINYEALLVLLFHLRDLFRNAEGEEDRLTTYYDWSLGIVQYIVGSLVIMASITAIEGCTLSLMSKVAPPKLESKAINLGLIVSLIRPSTRFMADVFILLVGLSHRIINTDIINSLSLVLICACCAVYYLVKRHYFFLSGL